MAQDPIPNSPPAAPTQTQTPQSASLYVGELAPEVTEPLLFDIFREVGPIASIRVCRDRVTRRSLGYAYVNFQNRSDAERTLDALNFMKIKDRACRIMWAQRDPQLRKTGRNNIFIKNLDPAIDDKTLHDTFSQFGTILSCKVKKNPNGESSGYGFVHFESDEAAKNAIELVNNKMLNEKVVTVTQFQPRSLRPSANVEETFTNVYVKNLDVNVTKEDLTAAFQKFGNITNAAIQSKIFTDSEGNEVRKSLGFGFVNFDLHDAAVTAVGEMKDKIIDGLTAKKKVVGEGEQINEKAIPLYVARAQPKFEREKLKEAAIREQQLRRAKYVNFYVKNLPDYFGDNELRELFKPYGKLASVKVNIDPDTKLSKGHGFVSFENTEEAHTAYEKLKSQLIDHKPLYISLFQKKEYRQNLLQQIQYFNTTQQRTLLNGNVAASAAGAGNSAGMNAFPPMANFTNINQQFAQANLNNMMMPFFAAAASGGINGMNNAAAAAAFSFQNYNQLFSQQQPSRMPPTAGARFGGSGGGQQRGGGGGPNARGGGRGFNPQRTSASGGVAGKRPENGVNYSRDARNVQHQQQQPTTTNNLGASSQSGGGGLEGGINAIATEHLAAQLAQMNETDAKSTLGDHLYTRLVVSEPELAQKITGMLLELDTTEIINLLEDHTVLRSKIEEAKAVLKSADASLLHTEGPLLQGVEAH